MPTRRKPGPQRPDTTSSLLEEDLQSKNVDRQQVDAATDAEFKPEAPAAQGGGSDWKS